MRGEQRAAETARGRGVLEGTLGPGRTTSRLDEQCAGEDIVLKPIPSTPIVNHYANDNRTFNITIDGGPNRDNDLTLAKKVGEEIEKALSRREDRMRQLRRAVPVDRTKVRLH